MISWVWLRRGFEVVRHCWIRRSSFESFDLRRVNQFGLCIVIEYGEGYVLSLSRNLAIF